MPSTAQAVTPKVRPRDRDHCFAARTTFCSCEPKKNWSAHTSLGELGDQDGEESPRKTVKQMILGLPEFWCRMSSNNSCLVSGDVARDLIATADRTVLQSWLYDAVWTSYKSVVKHPVENILLIMSWSLRMLEPSHPFRKQWPHWFSAATHILWWAGPLDPRWNIFVDVCGNSPAACRCCSNVWWDSSPFRGPNIQDMAFLTDFGVCSGWSLESPVRKPMVLVS